MHLSAQQFDRSDGTWIDVLTSETSVPVLGGFRGMPWGASRQQVREAERESPDVDDDDYLAFAVTILQRPFLAVYTFEDESLVSGRLIQNADHASDLAFLAEYDQLVDLLSQKFGRSDSTEYWNEDLYKDEPQRWGFAVSVGHYSRFAKWTTTDTDIVAGLHGDNYEIKLGVDFHSRSARAMVEMNARRRDLDQI